MAVPTGTIVPDVDELKHDKFAPDDAADEDACLACLTAVPNCNILPCRHMVLCCACARAVGQNGDALRGTIQCPKCRDTNVKSIQRVFL